MDATTPGDAFLEAFRTRQQDHLAAGIDVADRLRRLKATADNGWWDDLTGYRETLVATATRALTPWLGRGAGAGEYGSVAGTIVNEVYGLARYHAPELRPLSPAQRRNWLLIRTLERVEPIVRENGSRTVPTITEQR
jgi:hypothetical protein